MSQNTRARLLDHHKVNRVEPRELNSRPVLGENFLFKEVAMTEDSTITQKRLGGL